jgi:hypothetical protein
MAECSEIEAGGEVRTIKDATARNGVEANAAAIAAINEKIPSDASPSNKMITAAKLEELLPKVTTGTTSEGNHWEKYGNVVKIIIKKQITVGEIDKLPFAPLYNGAATIFYGVQIVGYIDYYTNKNIAFTLPSDHYGYADFTYITNE